jgi:hypothetical protein
MCHAIVCLLRGSLIYFALCYFALSKVQNYVLGDNLILSFIRSYTLVLVRTAWYFFTSKSTSYTIMLVPASLLKKAENILYLTAFT